MTRGHTNTVIMFMAVASKVIFFKGVFLLETIVFITLQSILLVGFMSCITCRIKLKVTSYTYIIYYIYNKLTLEDRKCFYDHRKSEC